ncbi:hypothetical protein POSPLADRAFT_1047205 [Postia placenta MAD-698-R-SB12]|uniref:methionyl-tRNA formyltransferase n=1 Tax=Postia placenta MAD-698-R-SB12 TaxID=670580 RepID=A0A1X6MXC8_9APHY|nr:hypothetical protein POSPLADRAFT_1047205 [Postia placenta MAD-698-R-SB12]OSX60873.1 hypothetical protein POSPLADRAFT_1047205 [Postia placenta MAD-698-R-SB12]
MSLCLALAHVMLGLYDSGVFLGRDEFSCRVLEHLHGAPDIWEDLAVVTQPDAKVGRRGSKLSVSPLKTLAENLSLPVHFIPPDKPSFKTWQVLMFPKTTLASLKPFQPPPPFHFGPGHSPPPSHMLVTASFGRILSNSLLALFEHGRRLNVHPSLLPAYRGAAPIQRALLDGQNETGVCVIEMMERKKGIDAGEIWGRRRMAIPNGIAFPELRDALACEGGQLLVSVLRDMLTGKATAKPQPVDPQAPRAPAIQAKDATVDFSQMTAEGIKPIITYLKTKRTLQLHSPYVCTEPPPDMENLLPAPGERHPESHVYRYTTSFVSKVKQQDRSLLKAKEWWNGLSSELRLSGERSPVQFLALDTVCP